MKRKYRNSIEEVRAIKETLAKKADYNIDKFFELCRSTDLKSTPSHLSKTRQRVKTAR